MIPKLALAADEQMFDLVQQQ